MKNFRGFPDNTEERHKIVRLALQVGGEGFDDMEPAELDTLITSHVEEELGAITKVSKEEEEEAGSDEEEVSRSKLMVKFLGQSQERVA